MPSLPGQFSTFGLGFDDGLLHSAVDVSVGGTWALPGVTVYVEVNQVADPVGNNSIGLLVDNITVRNSGCTDTDGDGTCDSNDACPLDPLKIAPGQCGCGVADTDTDSDGIADCNDNCDAIANPSQADCDNDGIGDTCELQSGSQWDTNSNGTPDQCEPCPAIHNYCTAGTTTNGCNATLSASGSPSVAASSGFTVTANNVEGQKTGLCFYEISGPKASVWAPGSSSYLCVKAPVQRIPSQSSGGTSNACDGTIATDLLAYFAAHPTALGQPLAAGLIANGQCWFRDPTAPGTTNLSDGIQWTFCP